MTTQKAPKWFTIEKSLIVRMERWLERQDVTELSVEQHWGVAYDYIQRYLPSVEETKQIEGLDRDAVCWLAEHVIKHVLVGEEDCPFCHPGPPWNDPRWWPYITAVGGTWRPAALLGLKGAILRGDSTV